MNGTADSRSGDNREAQNAPSSSLHPIVGLSDFALDYCRRNKLRAGVWYGDPPARSTKCSAAVGQLLADKKFMNRLAWRVAWEIIKQMLPWLIAVGAAFWLGSWMTLKLLLR